MRGTRRDAHRLQSQEWRRDAMFASYHHACNQLSERAEPLSDPEPPRRLTRSPRPVWNGTCNAVAAAVAQGRADWRVTLDTIGHARRAGLIPVQHEQYDFVVPAARAERPAVQAFRALLDEQATREAWRGWECRFPPS